MGNELGGIPLIGGSSGDGLDFIKTSTFYDGIIHENVAVLLFVTTSSPFEVFKIQHFEVSDIKLVITRADSTQRIVHEINGAPAAEAYAEILELKVEDLNADVYSANPLVLKIADTCYVRSIQKVNADLSLTFFCAIENGLVLSIPKKSDIVDSTVKQLNDIDARLGGSSCIHRRLEVLKLSSEKKNRLYSQYSRLNAVGFHTYGEQFGLVHVNQTLTGVMFGSK